MKKIITTNRRQFLTGAGGFLLSIPLLPSLLSQSASASPSNSVNRFVSILRRDGAPIAFWPDLNFSDLTKLAPTAHGIELSKIQGDLSYCFGEKYNALRNQMLILKSINGMEKNADHGSQSILTAMNYKKFPENTGSYPAYESIDQMIIEKLYENDPFAKQLNIQYSWSSKRKSYSYTLENGSLKNLPAYNNPFSVFNDFFNFSNNDSQIQIENNNLVIDKVLEHFNSVKNNRRISRDDKKRLDEFAQEIFETQKKLNEAFPKNSCSIPTNVTNDNYTTLADKIELTFKVMSLAIKCDRTRQINLDFNPDTLIGNYFNGKQHHGVSHSNNADTVKIFADMHKWHHDFIADFLVSLQGEDPYNPGKSFLENTLVFMSNEIGNQGNSSQSGNDANHIRVDVPCVLFGNVNSYFKTGMYIDYRNSNTHKNGRWYRPVGHPYNQVLTTIMDSFGVPYTRWEKNGVVGYGDYTGTKYSKSHPDIMSLGNKRDPLPGIS